jgi:DNA-binding NarL/FixJ family response regulator
MPRRILVVDDEARLLRAISVCLRAEGYEVVTARNGAEALVRVAEATPDLVISDIRMPGIDGYRLARHLRSSPRTESIPLIFLTAKDTREDRIAGLRTGVDAYLVKPFDPEELLAVITNTFNRIERTSAEIAKLVSTVKGEEPAPAMIFDNDFTEAEVRVARTVAQGLSNKQIAAELSISIRTVEGHISNILSKKGWTSRVEIARYVIKRDNSN